MSKAKTVSKKEESTALVVLSAEEQAYLDSLPSEQPTSDSPKFNRLSINQKAKDSEGIKRPIGAWHIEGTDKYYDGVVKFRPVRYMYKLIRYNQSADGAWTVVGQTIYFNDFSEEILDSLGGIALGRKFGSQYSAEEKLAVKKLAGTYLDIFGYVTFDKEEHEVVYRVRGSKLMKVLNAFKSLPKDKRYSQYGYTMEIFQPDKEDYWDIHFEPDMSTVLPITPILEFDNRVMDYVRESNGYILSAHKNNRSRAVEDTFVAGANKPVIENTTARQRIFDSEIPF